MTDQCYYLTGKGVAVATLQPLIDAGDYLTAGAVLHLLRSRRPVRVVSVTGSRARIRYRGSRREIVVPRSALRKVE